MEHAANTVTGKPTNKVYVGTKIVIAEKMTHADFLYKKGKLEPNQETMGEGYEVTYDDGYVSWSPRDVFERCYRELTVKEKRMI